MDEVRIELVAALRRSTDEVMAFSAGDAATLARTYAPGKWSMRLILVHLCDAETVFFDRLRRVAADDKPLLWAYDENRWAEKLAYDRRSVTVTRDLFRATRLASIDLIDALPSEALARSGVHSEAGVKSFAQIARTIVTHTEHHLEQLRAIAQDRRWPSEA
ncbi:MAG: DinB family protein [Planctomycetes bacterium]|nr:DinB family protein [Planctomycetota bacterium]